MEKRKVGGKEVEVYSANDQKSAKEIKAELEKKTGKEIKEYFDTKEQNTLFLYLGYDPDEKYLFMTPDVFNILTEEKRPVFKFLAINQEIEYQLLNLIWENVKSTAEIPLYVRNSKELHDKCLSLMLKGWKNYRNTKGEEIKFVLDKDGNITEESLKLLPPLLNSELANFAFNSKDITEEECLSLKF